MLSFSAKMFALAAFAAVAIFVGVVLWRALFPPHPIKNATAADEQYSEQQSAEKEAPVSAAKIAADEKIATYTLALAIFTALLVLVSAFQIAFLIGADETARVAANAAQQSAEAAKQAIELSDKTAIRQLRAYVYATLTIVAYPFPPKEPDRYGIGFEIKNSGQTWARNVRMRTAVIPREIGTEYDPWDRAQWNDTDSRPATILAVATH
jgi:hypothetical protein